MERWQVNECAVVQAFADKLVEVVSMEDDYVWLHDYHLLVLPSLLRKRFNRIRPGPLPALPLPLLRDLPDLPAPRGDPALPAQC